MEKFQLKKMMLHWSFCILLTHQKYLHWPSTDVKCWVPVNHILQLLSILTVKKWIQRYTETVHWKSLNMKTLFYALINSNLSFYVKQFDHHLKLSKTLDFNTYHGFLFFVLYTVIPGYFKEFLYEIMKLNISKIKHHIYKVLNLQVHLIVLVLTHGNL